MRRRDFITLLGSAVVAWAQAAGAQQDANLPAIGWLSSTANDEDAKAILDQFRRALNEVGYIAGRNVRIEERWGEDQSERLPALAADLVRRRMSVIVTNGSNAAALAAKAASATIPVVFNIGFDPVKLGLVESFVRPGGNVTGVSNMAVELGSKRLELLHELRPNVKVFGVLVNPNNLNKDTVTAEAEAAARALGLQAIVLAAGSEGEFNRVFAEFAHSGVGAVDIGPDPYFNSRPNQLASQATSHGLPAVYTLRKFLAAGGLMSYGPAFGESIREAAFQVAKILKGAKPAELPVLQPTRFELVINLKAAKVIDLQIPESLLVRADEVIE